MTAKAAKFREFSCEFRWNLFLNTLVKGRGEESGEECHSLWDISMIYVAIVRNLQEYFKDILVE